ncbi:MAG TPA: transketolase [Devosiaceae bacterium]|nr:transketolase [Devosiaceae bacterium]
MTDQPTPDEMANAIRSLSMDAVEKANSGHPGLPMGAADVAVALFTKVMKFDPADPHWPDRDRFVLSAGHGSMLLYSALYLLGYEDMTIDQIKNFRQLNSKTPGHPEHGFAAGVEATTGPLGQGIANGVGMALAEAHLRAEFGPELVDHHTWVLAGDGCLMEGISQEAISLAGHLQLGKLTIIWDNNHVTLDGKIEDEDSTDQLDRFRAVGWHTISIDGHDQKAIEEALLAAKKSDQPTLIAARTTIGFGAPTKSGTSKVHGSPLGAEELAGAKKNLGITYPAFEVPNRIIDAWRKAGERGAPERAAWQKRLREADPAKRAQFERRQQMGIPDAYWPAVDAFKQKLAAEKPKLATRKASQNALEVINGVLPGTIGGSADLTSSNFTNTSQTLPILPGDFAGRYVRYGVREHAMAATMNGIALHGGLLPYGGTFLTFTDYARPAIRLSALMKQRVIYVMTHDSIGLGEDGPTHQPVEHLTALRAIPDLLVLRPADATETLECWQIAIEHKDTPSVLALSRQGLPALRTEYVKENLSAKGAYVIAGDKNADVVIFATGSEVSIAVDAQKQLAAEGIAAKVVSVPSMELFYRQPDAYRAEIIGKPRARVAIEAGVRMSWDRLLGETGRFVGMHSFGASAPIEDLYAHFGITANAVVEAVKAQL